MTILYTVGEKLYINITNRCPCACIFCIRNNGDGAYGSDSLWLEREPTVSETIEAFTAYNLDTFTEIVFCGFGEPLERIDAVVEIARHLKSIGAKSKIRINTNGLSDLINKRETAAELLGAIDIVSVSLNAGSEAEYLRVTQPSFGTGSFLAMQRFSTRCKALGMQVMFTVVDVISAEEIAAAQRLAQSLGIELHVRKYDE